MLPALNEMFDIATSRVNALRTHVPPLIVVLLGMCATLAALLAGYGMVTGRHRDWLHMFTFAAVVAIAFYVTLDLEYPRSGLIKLDVADQVLRDLQRSMQ